jgi:iron complex outermembrane receptor protein
VTFVKNIWVCLILIGPMISCVPDAQAEDDLLVSLSLEELMNVEVTLASRKEERLFETAAAIFVLTQEDIRRSGATSIPEALRLVPGMQVARLDANKWAISARGFNDRLAQKLLVLIDGRTVYTPIFSGVFWGVQDLMLEDVERIELIRGPGATLWGANAVNGIINIITKNAQDTQGTLIRLGAGTEERGFGAVRYGGKWGKNTYFRLYTKYFNRDAFVDASGKTKADDWSQFRTGFRSDWQPSLQDHITTQGAIFTGKAGQTFKVPTLTGSYEDIFDADTDQVGGHFLARWDHTLSATSGTVLQTFYDRNRRMDPLSAILRETYDVDFQHRFALGRRQHVVWGMGYRTNRDTTRGSLKLSFDPPSRKTHTLSAFAQNEISVIQDRLSLTLGSKVEHNSFTGMEYQPNARFLWTPRLHHTLWGAVSRAVRTPARADDDVLIAFQTFKLEDILPETPPGGPPILVFVKGNPDFESEKMIAYELGYRVQPQANLFFDVATFYNVYTDLRAGRDSPFTFVTNPNHFESTLVIDNLMDGKTHGLEVVVDWQSSSNRTRFRASYSYLNVDLDLKPGANSESQTAEVGNPKHQAYFHASLMPHQKVQFDGMIRFVARSPARADDISLPFVGLLPRMNLPRYTELDLRIGLHLSQELELSIVGQNLLQAHHAEAADFFLGAQSTQIQRGVYSTLLWSF